MTTKRLLKLAYLLVLVPLIGHAVPAGAQNLLKNGGLEEVGDNPSAPAGWTGYRWEGAGSFGLTTDAAAAGSRSFLIRNDGAGKSALFQSVKLAPCTYRYSGLVASHNLQPGTWNMTTAAHLTIEGANLHKLVANDTGWHRFEWTFEITSQREVTAYVFNYGSGWLFVDDLKLEAVAGCARSPARFSLDTVPVAPLKYDPPVTPEDTTLAGYCDAPQMARGPVCTRLAKTDLQALRPKPAAAPRSLDGFENPAATIFPGAGIASGKPLSGRRSGLVKSGSYIAASLGAANKDWRGYSWLRFEVDNSSPRPQKVLIELGDHLSKNYFSRVNWYAIAAPGRSTLSVPLQNFVGERVSVGERRRLELATIERLVISAAEASVDITVDDVRLEPEPDYANDFARLVKLDVGPSSGPTMTGFNRLLPSMHYAENRGFGIIKTSKIGRVEDRRHPDDLFRDWISFQNGGLDFDLPNGQYDVWMMLEDPGYWEYYPSYKFRRVTAQGRTVLDDRQTGASFLDRYLAHSNDEDWPGDDVWQRYIKRRYQPLRFTSEVSEGKLRIRFDSDFTPTANALSALLIWPSQERKRGEAFVEELWQRLREQFNRENKQLLPQEPTHARPPANALDGALSVFQRDSALPVHGNDWPEAKELVSRVQIELARGETKVVALGLNASSDLALRNVEFSVPGFTGVASSVRSKVTRLTADGTVYSNIPRLLDPLPAVAERPVSLPKGRTRGVWVEVSANADAPAGERTGELRITLADGRTHTLPMQVKLHDWKLPDLDIPVGWMGVGVVYPAGPHPEVEARRLRELPLTIDLLQAHGMNTVTGGMGGPRVVGYNAGRLEVDFTKADVVMSAIKGRFKGPVSTYLGLGLDGIPSNRTEEATRFGRPYGDVLRDALLAVSVHSSRNNWPQLEHVVGDEPSGGDIDASVAAASAFRRALPLARTGVFTSMVDPARDETRKLAGVVKRLYLTLHSTKAIEYVLSKGSECSLYNQNGRYRQGVYLYKMKQLGCPGHLKFASNVAGSDPWYDLDSREMEYVAYLPHSDGRLRRMLTLVEARSAIDDYRYLLMLEQAIAAAPESADKRQAKEWLLRFTSSIEVGSDAKPALAESQLEALRLTIAQHVSKLVRPTR